MIPLSEWEELARERVYDRLESRETFKPIGIVRSKSFSDSQFRWEQFVFLCLSSQGNYVLAKETHQFPEGRTSIPFGKDSFFSIDVIDLSQEEADQYRFLIRTPLPNQRYRKPPLFA